ncbi:uncharacterized protein LOC131240319 [Magnolia sinica]|uniref:uncharacterized protein LOC131240319 n=1 Tax=Magnolia sinica TaxID=86752 RepID=UPI00265A1066|nr:uncharacterized protein LOC131240319 [Magnolia sinica]
MQIVTAFSLLFLLSFISLFHSTIQDLGPAPAPVTGADVVPVSAPALFSSPAPVLSRSAAPSPHWEENPLPEVQRSPASAPEGVEGEATGKTPQTAPPPQPPLEEDSETVRWCVVRDEFVDCQNYISLLKPTAGYVWKCVQQQTTEACLNSIKNGEADLINLDAGLAYIAFLNYSMKAIANEVYCNHAENYNSVAVVNRKACEENGEISLKDFKGRRSCHGGYSTATGWNYPVNHLKQFAESNQSKDYEIVSDFFSAVCAPSEFEGMGECGGCGNENGSCSSTLYYGHSGAFRCLVEELGDIAFVKEDTPLLYSMEGPYNKTWSIKAIKEFMYLCPQGGCREINGYPGSCILGTVPANVIMARNSISSRKLSVVLQTLLNATWASALYTGKNANSHVLSSSTQGLSVVKQLTRAYLGVSASISQTIQELNVKKVQATPSTLNTVPDVSFATFPHVQHRWMLATLSILLGLL